jgi:hypothetical protein
MRRLPVLSLIAGLVLAFPLAANAQSTPHLFDSETPEAKMEFLKNLRKRGHADLAKQFIERLLKTASKDELPLLNLEMARTSVALAMDQSLGQRAEMLEKARAAFEPFIKANPNSAAGAQARLEMAKLYKIQANMALNRALANDDSAAREKGAIAARSYYDAADSEFAEAIKVLKGLNQSSSDVVQAEFERANNYLEKANAYINSADTTELRQLAETIDKARKIFAEFAKDTESRNGLLANAYLVKCYQEGQDPPKAAEHYSVVLNSKSPNAGPAVRLAQYYIILHTQKDPNFKGDKIKEQIDRTVKWLSAYPAAKKSYEGEHLRFEQAMCYLQYAGGATKGFKLEEFNKLPPKDKSNVNTNLELADKIAVELAKEGGDFSERGEGLHRELQRQQSVFNPKKKLDFEGMLFTAEIKFQEASKEKDGPKRTKMFNDGQTTLRAALEQGEKENVAPGKLHDAQFLLGAAYEGVNDRHRSVIVFDALARANPPSKKGAEAAAQALRIYTDFMENDNDDRAREGFHDLTDFILSPTMVKLWASEPIVGYARYSRALDYHSDENYRKAVELLEQIPKEFPRFIISQGQGLFICLQARKAEETPEGKKAWTAKAKEFADRLGSLPAAADAGSTFMWFTAKSEAPKFLYAEAAELLRDNKIAEASNRYSEMAKNVGDLEAAFKKDGGKIAAEKKDKIAFTIEVLNKYARLGAADVEYRKGNYARVLEPDMLGSIVVELKGKDKGGDIPVVDVNVAGESLSLVLRSFVQLGNLEAAKGAYNFLMRIKAADGAAQDNANFTRALVADLATQVEDMKKNNEQKKLKEMVSKFTPFGDALAKNLVYDAKSPNLGDVKNLIRFYESLEQYKKAADLMKVVPEPKFLNQKKLKATESQDRELFTYWQFQIEKGRLLRLSKDYEAANKHLNSIINHENARAQTLAKIEQIKIYEDRESYGTAIKLWGSFMGDLQRAGIGQNKLLQELYFDAYYNNALCFYKLSQKPESIKAGKSDPYIKASANYIVRLQNAKDNLGWSLVGPKFIQYMSREPALKKAYDDAARNAK